MSFNQQLISKNILQNSTVLDFQKVSKFNQMQLFNMSQYNDKDGNIFLIPNFIQLYNYKNKKREIFLNKDYIEYIISFDSPTIEIILDRLTEAEINITDLQLTKLDTSEAYNVFYQKINLANATKYVLSQTNNVLSLWNLNLDFYDKTEIDDFLDNVSALLDLKLTQPVNMTAGQQIIAINPDQSVQLINASGLNYVSEDTINKTLILNVTDVLGVIYNQINGQNKLTLDANNTVLNNSNSIELKINNNSQIKQTENETQFYDQIQGSALDWKTFYFGKKYTSDPGSSQIQNFQFKYSNWSTLAPAQAFERTFFTLYYNNRQGPQEAPKIDSNCEIFQNFHLKVQSPYQLYVRYISMATNVTANTQPINIFAPVYINPDYYIQQTSLGFNTSYWQQQPNSIQYYIKVSSGSYINGNTYTNSSSDWYRWILRLSSQGGLLCHSQLIMSSTIHIKDIVKEEKQLFESFKLDDFFNYNICSYKYKKNSGEYQNNKEEEIFGVFMEQFKQDKKHDQFLKKAQYQLHLIEERKEKQPSLKKKIDKKDLYFYFDFCLDKFAQHQTEFAISQGDEIINVSDIDYQTGFVTLEKEIDFSKDLILLINSYGFDLEKTIQYVLVQNKFLFDKVKEQQKQIEQISSSFRNEIEYILSKLNI